MRVTRTGASTLAIGIAMLATPAAAQQVLVGSAQCPVVGGVATCEGNLSGGVTSQQSQGHAPVRTINIRNTTVPIAPTTGIFGIGADRNDNDLTINVADGVVIDVFDNLAIAEPAQGVVGLLRGGRALTIDNGATITSNGGGSGAGGPGAGIEGDAFGLGGSVTIVNRGRITANSTTDRSTAIAGQLFNGANGDIRITNSGALFANSTAAGERDNAIAGITANDSRPAAGGGQIVVTNSGAITVRTNPAGFDTNFQGIAAGIVTNGLSTNSNTVVTNTGAIDSQGSSAMGIVAFSQGTALTGDTSILIDNRGTIRVDGTGNGLFAQTAGEKVDATIRNAAAGTISLVNTNAANLGTSGIQLLSQARTGALTVDNDAAITTAGTAFSRGISIGTAGAAANGNYTMLLDNSGAITIGSATGQGLQIGATRDDNANATLINTGILDLRATTGPSAAISVNLGAAAVGTGDGTTVATITNSGEISVGVGNGMFVNADTIAVTNTGAIATTGGFSDAVDLLGTGNGPITFTTTGNITAAGANSDAIAIYGIASAATLNVNGATVSAPRDIANSENYAVRIDGNIGATLNLTNAATVTGNLIFAGGNDTIALTAGNRIIGNLALGAGNDTVTLTSATYAGAIDLGAGDDRLDLTQFSLTDLGAITAIEGGAGADTVNFRVRDGDTIAFPLATLPITDVETFAQTGAGTVTLAGTSPGFNTTYELRQGSLNQNAALANTNLATSAGTFAAVSGTVRNLSVAGDLLPGGAASTGRATVGGNFTMASTGTYFVDILANGTSDVIGVTGTAALGGRVSVNSLSPDSAYGVTTSYTILTAAGGITGTFGSLVNEDLPLINLTLNYSTNAVRLDVKRSTVAASTTAQTYNQRQVAGVIDATELAASGDLRTVINALVGSTTPQALEAFDTSSGELHASILGASVRRSQVIGNAMQTRLHARAADADESGSRFALWASGGLLDGEIGGDGNAVKITSNSKGGVLGIETASRDGTFIIGVAGGYATTNVDVAGRLSSADIDGWQAGAYGRYGTGGRGVTVSGSVSYSRGTADTRRVAVVNTISRTAQASYDVDTLAVGAETRFGFAVGGSGVAFGPLATIDIVRASRRSFAESGADALNLSGGREDDDLAPYAGGGFVNWHDGGHRLDVSVAYEHNGGDFTATRLALQGAPNIPFQVRSPTTNRNSTRVGFTGEAALGAGWAVGATYRGRIARSNQDHSGMLTLSWRQ